MAVKFDAANIGATANASSGNTINISWTHTPVDVSNLAVLVGVVIGKNGTGIPDSVTYGGIPMSFIDRADISGAGTVSLYGLVGAPPGAQTVELSHLASSATGMAASSVSYTGVGKIGSTVPTTSSTASVSLDIPVDGITMTIIGGSGSNITSFNRTTRAENDTNQIFVLWATLMGDTDTLSYGSNTFTWSGGSGTRAVAAQLLPAMPFYQML